MIRWGLDKNAGIEKETDKKAAVSGLSEFRSR